MRTGSVYTRDDRETAEADVNTVSLAHLSPFPPHLEFLSVFFSSKNDKKSITMLLRLGYVILNEFARGTRD